MIRRMRVQLELKENVSLFLARYLIVDVDENFEKVDHIDL